jgi:predicted ATPase/class 3 adenylate cyclase
LLRVTPGGQRALLFGLWARRVRREYHPNGHMEPPTGTVTFLFTDIEGSTQLLQDLGPRYEAVQNDHMRLMREAITAETGTEIRTEGDSFFAVFRTAGGAIQAVVAAQRAFYTHQWTHGKPLRVRMGVHTGEGRRAGDDYLGIDVNRAARIAAAGHGGQVLVSAITRSLVERDLPEGVSLRDLGEHQLKDLAHPEHLHELLIDGLPSEFPLLKTVVVASNLPVQLTSFVGRERDVARVTHLLGRSRLVTLTGPGGTGKTRLAVEAASHMLDRFADGVFFVDLSSITDPRLVPDTIASVLRLRPESVGRPVIEILTDHLRNRSLLLVIDNFEQVLDGAETVATILRASPRVRGLVTSRAPLRLSGEQELSVAPLEVPDPARDPALLRHNEAVALFLDRAAAVDSTFSINEETIRIVGDICLRLDGLPLAIELAAARVRVLSPRFLLEQLDRRLTMLVGGPRDAPSRQRTLRAAIAWSYELLEERVRAFFRRLSPFAGGWTLEAAGYVANPKHDIGETIELTELLLRHSLVQRAPDDAEGRLRMLDTIREFGLERLEESGEAEDVRKQHALRFLEIAEEAEGYLTGPEQRRWLDLLSREHDNLRVALGWAIADDGGEMALRLGGALWRFWYARGHLDEGRRWLEAALGLPSSKGRSTSRASALTALGGVAYWQGDFVTAHAAYAEALDIHRTLGDHRAVVQGTFDLANAKAVMGDPQTAESLLQESLGRARDLGDRRGEAWALWGLGAARMFGGDLPGARMHLEASLRVFEEVGNDTWGLGNALAGLAGLAAQRGDPVEASDGVLRALDLWEDQGNALVISGQLRFLAMAANDGGQPERAVRLAGAAEAWRNKVGGQVPAAFFPFADPREAAAEMLDEVTLERAWEEGSAMSLEEALAYAREDG